MGCFMQMSEEEPKIEEKVVLRDKQAQPDDTKIRGVTQAEVYPTLPTVVIVAAHKVTYRNSGDAHCNYQYIPACSV